jgi:hypothetical protein
MFMPHQPTTDKFNRGYAITTLASIALGLWLSFIEDINLSWKQSWWPDIQKIIGTNSDPITLHESS